MISGLLTIKNLKLVRSENTKVRLMTDRLRSDGAQFGLPGADWKRAASQSNIPDGCAQSSLILPLRPRARNYRTI